MKKGYFDILHRSGHVIYGESRTPFKQLSGDVQPMQLPDDSWDDDPDLSKQIFGKRNYAPDAASVQPMEMPFMRECQDCD